MKKERKKKAKKKKEYKGRVFIFVDSETKEESTKVIKLIKDCNMTVNEIKLDGRSFLRSKMQELTNKSNAPQVFFNSEHIGDHTTITDLKKNGNLLEMINSCKLQTPGDLYEVYRRQGEIFSIIPPKLHFPNPEYHNITCVLKLLNKTDKFGIFKVKTTQPKKYSVKPKCGIVKPGGHQKVLIHLNKTTEISEDDKFLLESVSTNHYDESLEEKIGEIFKEVKKTVKQKIFCDFGKPPNNVRIIRERGENVRIEVDEERAEQEEILQKKKEEFVKLKQIKEMEQKKMDLKRERIEEEQKRKEIEERLEREKEREKEREEVMKKIESAENVIEKICNEKLNQDEVEAEFKKIEREMKIREKQEKAKRERMKDEPIKQKPDNLTRESSETMEVEKKEKKVSKKKTSMKKVVEEKEKAPSGSGDEKTLHIIKSLKKQIDQLKDEVKEKNSEIDKKDVTIDKLKNERDEALKNNKSSPGDKKGSEEGNSLKTIIIVGFVFFVIGYLLK